MSTTPEEATSENKPEVESKKLSAGEEKERNPQRKRKNKTEEAKRKKNEAADRKNYENQVESKVVEPPSEQIEAVTKIQEEATSENKPEVESKKPESEAEVKDTPKADENRKNKTEEAKRKKNEAADRKNYENQVESKVVEPPSEQIEAVTKIQDVTQPLKQEMKDDHKEATSENKPEVESKKVSAGDKEKEKSTEERKPQKISHVNTIVRNIQMNKKTAVRTIPSLSLRLRSGDFFTSCYAETDCSEVAVAITEFGEVCKVRPQFSGACLKRQVSCGQHHFSCIALSGQKQIKSRKDGFFLGLLFPPQHHLQFWKAMWRIQYEHWSLVEERPSLVFSVS
ncbi:hypothetical protein ScPMuIL_011142 [Solemya velum]